MQTQKRAKKREKEKEKNQFWSSENDWRVVETNPPYYAFAKRRDNAGDDDHSPNAKLEDVITKFHCTRSILLEVHLLHTTLL